MKFVMTKSSIDRLKASSAAAMMPGRMSGKVTFQKVVQLVRAEVHRGFLEVAVGKPDSRALTVTTTKLMLNMMWAMRIVVKPSG